MRLEILTTSWAALGWWKKEERPACSGEPSDARPEGTAAHQRGFIPRCLQSSTDFPPSSSQGSTLHALNCRPVIGHRAPARTMMARATIEGNQDSAGLFPPRPDLLRKIRVQLARIGLSFLQRAPIREKSPVWRGPFKNGGICVIDSWR